MLVVKKLKNVIIYAGTSDFQSNKNIIQNTRKIIKSIENVDVINEFEVAFSSIIHHIDHQKGI